METADRLLSLRQCYEDYMNDRRAMLQEGGAFQGVSRFFTGPPAGERMIAKRFLQQVEEWLAQLDREDAGLVTEVVGYMLLDAQGFDYNSQLMFQAAEPYTLPLIGCLSREDAARLLRGYAARYPKRRQLLPKQEEVLNALVRAAG